MSRLEEKIDRVLMVLFVVFWFIAWIAVLGVGVCALMSDLTKGL